MKAIKVEELILSNNEKHILNDAIELLAKISDTLEREEFSNCDGSLLDYCNLALSNLGEFIYNCEEERN